MTSISIFILLAQGDGSSLPMWPVIVGIVVLFYLLILAPDRRRRAEHDSMMNAMKANDRVVTIGGIKGVVVDVDAANEVVVIRVDDKTNTQLRVRKSAISEIEMPKDKEKGSK